MGSLVKDYFARRQVSWPFPQGQHSGQATSFHVKTGAYRTEGEQGWVEEGPPGVCTVVLGPGPDE